MIEFREGNLLAADVEALVNTVNCVGVMGKGIALQCKQAFPENFRAYERACARGEVQLGRMFVYRTEGFTNPKHIINFPTKQHWKAQSHLGDIELGLIDLLRTVQQLDIKSLAIPPLGCGNGGLDWEDVRPRIEVAFGSLPDVLVLVYAPQPSPKAERMPVHTDRPRMTRGRALVILLIERYRDPGYRLGMLEIQKLAYFLQVAGEPLRLKYVKDKFGPYAEALHHVIQRMEGHFLRGYGDRSREASVSPLPGAVEEALDQIKEDSEGLARLDRVSRLIEGFETPYGMELLASLLWITTEDPEAATDPKIATERLHEWNSRKRKTFRPEHALKAWLRLQQENWLGVAKT